MVPSRPAPQTGRVYDFAPQLKLGLLGENVVDEILGPYYGIYKPPHKEDRRFGIDRILVGPDGHTTKAQVKCDFLAKKTGNFFIEPFAFAHCRADVVIFYAPRTGWLFMCDTTVVRQHIPLWQEEHGLKTVRNRKYESQGIPVPCCRIARIASWSLKVDESNLFSFDKLFREAPTGRVA